MKRRFRDYELGCMPAEYAENFVYQVSTQTAAAQLQTVAAVLASTGAAMSSALLTSTMSSAPLQALISEMATPSSAPFASPLPPSLKLDPSMPSMPSMASAPSMAPLPPTIDSIPRLTLPTTTPSGLEEKEVKVEPTARTTDFKARIAPLLEKKKREKGWAQPDSVLRAWSMMPPPNEEMGKKCMRSIQLLRSDFSSVKGSPEVTMYDCLPAIAQEMKTWDAARMESFWQQLAQISTSTSSADRAAILVDMLRW